MTIHVTVILFGALRQATGGAERAIELPENASVRDALAACGLPDRVDIWALVDGQRAERQARLTDGARVELFQPVGGG